MATVDCCSLPNCLHGISALEIVCQLRPDLPFIFVSGRLGEELAIEALKRGATDYVLKQRLGRLVPCVQRALREAQERRELQTGRSRLAAERSPPPCCGGQLAEWGSLCSRSRVALSAGRRSSDSGCLPGQTHTVFNISIRGYSEPLIEKNRINRVLVDIG
jgi:hypothetical protein